MTKYLLVMKQERIKKTTDRDILFEYEEAYKLDAYNVAQVFNKKQMEYEALCIRNGITFQKTRYMVEMVE